MTVFLVGVPLIVVFYSVLHRMLPDDFGPLSSRGSSQHRPSIMRNGVRLPVLLFRASQNSLHGPAGGLPCNLPDCLHGTDRCFYLGACPHDINRWPHGSDSSAGKGHGGGRRRLTGGEGEAFADSASMFERDDLAVRDERCADRQDREPGLACGA